MLTVIRRITQTFYIITRDAEIEVCVVEAKAGQIKLELQMSTSNYVSTIKITRGRCKPKPISSNVSNTHLAARQSPRPLKGTGHSKII